MRELFSMWRNTRMVVMTAISAAAYVAVLLPFKGFVLIPGLTEVRPGAAIPIVMSFLAGPAAAWGSGFGNVIADALGGMIGPGSFFGFLGNFFYGFVPYALWRAFMGRKDPIRSGPKGWLAMAAVLMTACLVIGSIVGWGVDLLGLVPFAALGLIIAVNNFIASAAIATVLLALLYGRVRAWGLLYYQVLDDEEDVHAASGQLHDSLHDGDSAYRPRKTAALGGLLLVAGAVLAFSTGLIVSGEMLQAGYGTAAFASGQAGNLALTLRMAPGLLMILVAVFLL